MSSHQDLTKLGLFFGRISEVHLKNMKSFPLVFFNDVSDFLMDYDIATSKTEASFIRYNLNISKENDKLEIRCKHLESAIRSLFWKEVRLELLINGKEVYKSE